MLYDWVGERQLHLTILQSLELEDNFNTDMFPRFSISGVTDKNRRAEYHFPDHNVVFNECYIQDKITTFSHTYFHELAHGTSKYTNRWERIWANSSPHEVKHIVGLEEQIADLVAFIWCDIFDKKFDFSITKKDRCASIKNIFNENKTKFKLPWKEVEDAVFCLLKNKSCNKAMQALKYYKQLITDNEFANIKEGIFNG
jgi:hypothetical protein